MEDTLSPTDISSSLSEFVRKERILKELYQENCACPKSLELKPLQYNDEEIDGILQQMGRLLSPAGQESDNLIYKHVIEETENKSIEQILSEAKELISDSAPIAENVSVCNNSDHSSSENSEDSIRFVNIKDMNNRRNEINSSDTELQSKLEKLNHPVTKKLKNVLMPGKNQCSNIKKESLNFQKVEVKYAQNNEKIESLREEVVRVTQLYDACKQQCSKLKNEIFRLEQQWNQREKQIIEENRQLKQSISSAVSQQEFENFGKKLNNANEMINHLKSNLKKATEEWNKKEMKLIDECNQLRCKLKNSPKILQPDVEKLQEQLKDTQEVNVKLKLDLDSYKDKCRTLETLCADLKKVIVDEQIAEKVFANDNIPASVKQFLSSSSSSVFNTLSHMFGCLSRSASRNRNYLYSGQKGDLFTTTESSMINDLTKSCEQNELMKELLKEKEQLRKENQDLNRQVKELEIIVRRRTHPNFSNVSEIIRSEESRMYEKESEIIKNLKKELLEKQQIILDLKNQIVDSKALYDKNLLSLQSKIVNIQEESIKLKEELEKNKNAPTNYIAKNKRKGRSCDPPSHATRNFRIELAAKEREVQLLNKQLEELKKKNRKLIKERENNFVSSKEQSADIIQLKNNYAAIVTESEEDDRYKYSTSNQEVDIEGNNVIDTQIQKQNIENGNFESSDDLVHNCVNNSHKFKNKVSSRQEYPLQTNLNISNNSECSSEKLTSPEVNHQNLVQITCDLLKLLTKTEFAAKIRNSNYSSSQYDELNRFVTALKSVSD